MAISGEQAYKEIKEHIDKSGEPYRTWYAGIASDPHERLFEEHNVPKENYWWIYHKCSTDEEARYAEEKLIELGCDGDTGGGDESTTSVYAYLKSSDTKP